MKLLATATVLLATAAVATLAGCSSPVRTVAPVAAGQTFTLTPGSRASLPQQASLRYVGVDSDSRCPPDVQCVWAGDAQVRLVFEQSGKQVDVVLHTAHPEPQPLGPWTLALVGLERGATPAATLRLDGTGAASE